MNFGQPLKYEPFIHLIVYDVFTILAGWLNMSVVKSFQQIEFKLSRFNTISQLICILNILKENSLSIE